jgi:hypothetical protein
VLVPPTRAKSSQGKRLSLAFSASAVAHAGFVLLAVVDIGGTTPAPIHRIVDGFRANTVEVGTLPDAARPPAEPESPAGARDPETPSAPEATTPPPSRSEPVTPDSPSPRELERTMPSAPVTARTRPPAAPRTALSASERRAGDSNAVAAPSSTRPASEEAGSFGAMGLPPGTQYFARAFARALPVVLGDVAWLALPAGPAGEALIDVKIDEAGRIADVDLDPHVPTPEILKRALDRVFILLNAGTFSLDGTRVQMGVERLALSASVSESPPNPDPAAVPTLMNEKGHRPPSRIRPGSAHLTFNSGRRVTVAIEMRPLE